MGVFNLVEFDHDLVGCNAVASADIDGFHGTIGFGADDILHLHRFDHANRLAFLDLLADLDIDRHDEARHRRHDQLGCVRLFLLRQAGMQISDFWARSATPR